MDNSEVNPTLSGAGSSTQTAQPVSSSLQSERTQTVDSSSPIPTPQLDEPLLSSLNSKKEEQKPITSKKRSKLPLIIISIIILIAAAGFAVYFFLLNPKNPIEKYPGFKELYENADYLSDSLLKNQEYIDSASSDEEKSNRYYETAIEIFDTCSDQQMCTSTALENLEKAFELHPTAEIAWRLYDYYSYLGNTEKSDYYLNQREIILNQSENSNE